MEWIQTQGLTPWLIVGGVLTAFVGSLLVIPLFVRRIPVDYLMRDSLPPAHFNRSQSAGRFLGRILKNLLGATCMVAGLAMLVLPGQGLITILVGIMLLDFPGKFTLERRFMLQPTVLRAINWIRAQANQPALLVPKRDTTARGNTARRPEHD